MKSEYTSNVSGTLNTYHMFLAHYMHATQIMYTMLQIEMQNATRKVTCILDVY